MIGLFSLSAKSDPRNPERHREPSAAGGEIGVRARPGPAGAARLDPVAGGAFRPGHRQRWADRRVESRLSPEANRSRLCRTNPVPTTARDAAMTSEARRSSAARSAGSITTNRRSGPMPARVFISVLVRISQQPDGHLAAPRHAAAPDPGTGTGKIGLLDSGGIERGTVAGGVAGIKQAGPCWRGTTSRQSATLPPQTPGASPRSRQ